jgi:hypothetical protein
MAREGDVPLSRTMRADASVGTASAHHARIAIGAIDSGLGQAFQKLRLRHRYS